jgi:hypothetical protein
MRYAGTTLMVLSAIGTVAAILSGILVAEGGGDDCLFCIVSFIAGPIAVVEEAFGLPLFLGGLHLELSSERGLRDLGFPSGTIPMHDPAPSREVGMRFRF